MHFDDIADAADRATDRQKGGLTHEQKRKLLEAIGEK